MTTTVRLTGVEKSSGRTHAVAGIDFSAEPGITGPDYFSDLGSHYVEYLPELRLGPQEGRRAPDARRPGPTRKLESDQASPIRDDAALTNHPTTLEG